MKKTTPKAGKSKVDIQKIILEIVSTKKAINIEDLISEVESYMPKVKARKTKPSYTINRTIKTLEKNGCLTIFPTEQSSFVQITNMGRHKLAQYYLSGTEHIVPTEWDGKWRIVILDVPEADKQTRNALRYILKKANFLCLKNSVWISPYAFEQFLYNMKENLGLQEEMMIMVTDYIDPTTAQLIKEKFLKEIDTKK